MNTNPQNTADRRTSIRLWRTVPMAVLLIALLIALFMISGAKQDTVGTTWLDDYYMWVLVVTLLVVIALLWGITSRLLSLIRRVRSQAPGALLAARWVRNFLVLSLPPALIVYFFSAWFLTNTIDSWFDVRVEQALEDSRDLGQAVVDIRKLEARRQLHEIADDLQELQEGGELLRRALLSHVQATGPLELSVLGEDGTLEAIANINALTGQSDRVSDFALLQVLETGEYAAPEPTDDGDLQIRVLVSMPPQYPGDLTRILQAIFPLPPDMTALTRSFKAEYDNYQKVTYLRESLKQSYLLILSLVALLTVLLAILAALSAARRMVAPLSRLSSATKHVAAGDFDRDVEAGERDEIGFLVSSFNEMTQALKTASLSAEQSRVALQAQGDYLETVLGNLSSGVLTLDAEENVIRANRSCKDILDLPVKFAEDPEKDNSLENLEIIAPNLEPFIAAIRHQKQRGKSAWQQEIRIDRPGSRLVLLARGSKLQIAEHDGSDHGQVIVFDDVTVLNQAQREAAWSEVARRLAHEVKNPLTPIRLAAERLRMKLSGKLESVEAELLDRATNTIVAQVEALRTLVDAFGDYASEPVLSRAPIKLDRLVRDVVSMYQGGDSKLTLALNLCPGPEGLEADSGRLRQMLHNLVRNAKEAAGTDDVKIDIIGQEKNFEGSKWLQLEIRDHGPGFPEKILESPFEPYVSHKAGGSGLGLAICRKIVSEHDGRITLGNLPAGGAVVTILLPLQ